MDFESVFRNAAHNLFLRYLRGTYSNILLLNSILEIL